MHSTFHHIAHRAPSAATRTKARWQPYGGSFESNSSQSSSRTPFSQTTYPNTPASIASSPLTTPSFTSEDSVKSAQSITHQTAPKDLPLKTKNSLGLVDQTVKCLSDMWHVQDIPPVFLTTSRTGVVALEELAATPSFHNFRPSYSNQLPSPISPSTPSNVMPDAEPTCMFGPQTLVPIKGFVHEVLRRSRTSGGVLQTALCYLEAIRPKVSELSLLEKEGSGPRGEPTVEDQIFVETEVVEADNVSENSSNLSSSQDCMDTVRISDGNYPATVVEAPLDDTLKKPKEPSQPLPPLPLLPSPLLCPRRAFLASLILASKFTQDKCYSNRAWAKLSGLPAREIGRCERALGDALGWRLWVGKTPVISSLPTSLLPPSASNTSRPLSRCQSENNLRVPSKGKFLSTPKKILLNNRLRRCATVPTDILSSSSSQPDIVMISPIGRDRVEQAQYDEIDSYNSSPDTPGLSSSPSSSVSSGDRTIQMSIFSDDAMSSSGGEDDSIWTLDGSPRGMNISPVVSLGRLGIQNLPTGEPTSEKYSNMPNYYPPLPTREIFNYHPHMGPPPDAVYYAGDYMS